VTKVRIVPIQEIARSEAAVRPRCVVAIPVKDEAERLPACLRALAEQRDATGRHLALGSFGVLIFANNCRDESAALASSMVAGLPFVARIVERRLPATSAHAGGARRAAMDLARGWLEESDADGGVILTTDADSRVPTDWIVANLAAIEAGADAVLGRIALDEEGDLLPPAVHRRGSLESAYEQLLTEVSALLDPLDHNPWPHHATISGASLGVTAPAYRRVGGLPRVPLGEDKAFVAALLRHDAHLRFAPDIAVVTSARLRGRAPGGVADTLRLRSLDPDASCDESLEPFRVAIKRAGWRGRLRRQRRSGELETKGEWSRALVISAREARRIAKAPTFGAAWSAAESASPLLARRLLTPADLPGQIAAARRALARLRRGPLAAPKHIKSETAIMLLARDHGHAAEAGYEQVGSLVTG
jgi:GT2 family glycosyltransferase